MPGEELSKENLPAGYEALLQVELLEALRGASGACQVVVCLYTEVGQRKIEFIARLEPMARSVRQPALDGGGNLVPSRRGGLPVEGGNHVASLDVTPNHSSRRRRASMVEDFSAVRRGVKPRGEPSAGTVSRAVLARAQPCASPHPARA